MSIWLKNCGLKSEAAIAQSIATGATHIGLMHYEPSPRHLGLEEGAVLRPHISVQATAVLVNPTDATLDTLIPAWQPDLLQLHGVTDTNRLLAIRARYRLPLILALNIAAAADIETAHRLADTVNPHALLLDAAKPGYHGGSGETFDWTLLAGYRPKTPWFLAGGLTAENVAGAIAATHPDGVDVSSGIEANRGVKSLEKIAAFNAAVLSTPHAKR